MPFDRADFVIVGAGTAGCVLARRLSEDPSVTVALLELGGMDTNPAIYDQSSLNPMFSLWASDAAENWGYKTEPQTALNNRVIDVARGRVVGGSSAINAMIYIRGNRRTFDTWAEMGNAGWSYEDALPYFKRSESYHGAASEFHGRDGPLSVIDYRKPSAAGHAFIEAAASLDDGSRYNDFNGASQEDGAGFYQCTKTPDGVRATAWSGFIRPVRERSNLRVLSGVRATRVIIEGGRAAAVEYRQGSGTRSIRAEREIILCGGAFETPKLMMLSGLGRADDLRHHGIDVVADLRGVGTGLQDHMLLGVGYESLVPLDPPEMLAEAGLFKWTPQASAQSAPDLQYFFGPVQFVAPQYMIDGPGFTFAPILAQPASRGTISLASSDASANARLDPQYLTMEEDVAVFEYGIRYARELAQTSAFDALRGRELAPGPNVNSSAELREYVRQNASTVWHPASTCHMGPDSDAEAVVDNQLRVRGVTGLRIADASVMPVLVNGNPNAAVMMIAEKAADLIRESGQ